MPALLTRMSTPPNSATAARTIAWISAGFEMSAPLKPTFTLNSSARPRRLLDGGGVAEAVEHHVRALGGERTRDAEPNAARGAGD